MRKNVDAGFVGRNPPPLKLRRDEGGQVLLIIILVMVVALTVGLSFISRSITTIRTSREEASSQKALSAAEAGIEQVLKTGVSITLGTFSGTDATYNATAIPVLGTEVLVNGGNSVPKDEGADIWLVGHNILSGDPDFSIPWAPLGGNLTIFWGSSSDVCNPNPAINTMAALEVVVISGSQASPILTRFVYDPCPGRRSNNNFGPSSPGGVVNGKSFSFSAALPLITNGLVARAVPLYKSTSIGVIASIALPSQGTVIDSTGVSQGTTRKINVFKGYPQLPIQYFSYGLFSP